VYKENYKKEMKLQWLIVQQVSEHKHLSGTIVSSGQYGLSQSDIT